MTTTAEIPIVGVGQPVPTLAEEMRGTLLLFGMFGLAFALLGVAVGALVLLQTVLSAVL
jgi:hypothetical protein